MDLNRGGKLLGTQWDGQLGAIKSNSEMHVSENEGGVKSPN